MEVKEAYYENAPIILSMMQFSYDKIEGFDINVIKKLANKVKSDFPVINERFVQSIVVNNKNNEETSVSVEDKQINGIQIMSNNRQEFFTITDTKFTFQSHQKYSGWENFSEKSFKVWRPFSEAFNILELKSVSLRYVNKINLPVGLKNITEYFTTHIQDNENNFSIGKFQFKFTSYDNENNFLINISHFLDLPIEESLPYVFDIDVFYNNKMRNEHKYVLELFEKIRNKKNELFNKGITEKTKKLIS